MVYSGGAKGAETWGADVALRRAGGGRRCDAATLPRCHAAEPERRCDAATLERRCDAVGAATLLPCDAGSKKPVQKPQGNAKGSPA